MAVKSANYQMSVEYTAVCMQQIHVQILDLNRKSDKLKNPPNCASYIVFAESVRNLLRSIGVYSRKNYQ